MQLSTNLTTSSSAALGNSSELDCSRLSQNFELSEFTHSATAEARGIDNTPSENIIANLKALCENVLQPLRDQFGTITIGSGYRCPKLNSAVGGVRNSQHMTGEAADIRPPLLSPRGEKLSIAEQTLELHKWFEWLKTNVVFDQLIWERNNPKSNNYWIHVSFKRNGVNRKQVIPLLNKHK